MRTRLFLYILCSFIFLNTQLSIVLGKTIDIASMKQKYSVEILKSCLTQGDSVDLLEPDLFKLGGYEVFRFIEALKSNSKNIKKLQVVKSNNSTCFEEFLTTLNEALKEVNPQIDLFNFKLNLSPRQSALIGKSTILDGRNYTLFIYQADETSKDLGLSWSNLSGGALLSVRDSMSDEQFYTEVIRQIIHEYYVLRDAPHDMGNLFSDNEYSCLQSGLDSVGQMVLANYRGAKFENELGVGRKVKDFKTISDIFQGYSIPNNLYLLFRSMDSTQDILEIANQARCEHLRTNTTSATSEKIFEVLTTPKLNFGDITFTSTGPGCESCAGSGWFIPDEGKK